MLVFLAFGLAMDAFAVSVTNGMCYRANPMKTALGSGLAFGFFQGMMPLVGYLAGHAFSDVIGVVDHWIALLLLGFIGGRMIAGAVRARQTPEDCPAERAFSLKTLSVQAVATSIDALVVGVGLGVMQVSLLTAVSVIAAITFCCSFAGVHIGRLVGGALGNKAEALGGCILVLIGLRIFLEHLGIWH